MENTLDRPATENSNARRWNLIAVAIASLTALGVALLPFGTSSSTDTNGLETSSRVSLLSSEGVSVLIVLAIPVLLVAVPLLLGGNAAVHRTRIAIVGVLVILAVLAAASIGVFFVPTLIAMIMTLVTNKSTRFAPPAKPA